MDRLWTPWRYGYITGSEKPRRPGVPRELEGWPGDGGSVFRNMILSVQWAVQEGVMPAAQAERAAGVLLQAEHVFVCLNAFPYTSGHVMVVPYEQVDSLAKLAKDAADEMMAVAQRMELALRATYTPEGINLGMNLGEAAGAGVAEHLHLHILPRWFGDNNFMTATAETRVLPESLDVTWTRLRGALGLLAE